MMNNDIHHTFTSCRNPPRGIKGERGVSNWFRVFLCDNVVCVFVYIKNNCHS